MRCPFCGHDDTQVKDSRPTEDNAAIRRRRFCPICNARVTTFERVQLRELTVVKSNGQREHFDRDKLLRSMRIALRKRPIDADRIDRVVNSLVRQLESSGENEIPTKTIGQMVMGHLAALDQVAYVRYASVYKDFTEASDFNEFVGALGPDRSTASGTIGRVGGHGWHLVGHHPSGSAAHVARRPALCLGTCFVTERMSGYVARPA